MSSKKQLRRERRRKAREEKAKGGRNPVLIFIVGIALALVAVAVGAYFLRGDGVVPFPGAVWSAEHGHWH